MAAMLLKSSVRSLDFGLEQRKFSKNHSHVVNLFSDKHPGDTQGKRPTVCTALKGWFFKVQKVHCKGRRFKPAL